MSYKQAVDDVKKLTRYFKSLESICEALEGIASIDQARDEAMARLTEQRANVELNLANEVAKLNELCKQSDALRDEMAASKAAAQSEAKRLVTEAHAECDDERKRLAAQREDAKRAENEAYEQLQLVNDELTSAKAVLADVNNQIESAKALVRRFAE